MTREIFLAFLRLGLTSFGGPVAHLGYFRREFVERRRWLDEARFAQLVALCQLLPGPASSQLGFTIGLLRGGWTGAVAAFVAFTAPSALLLYGFARLMPRLDSVAALAVLQGLKLLTVAVVAHAVVGMARTLTPDVPRMAIAAACAALALWIAAPALQPLAILAGAALGLLLQRAADAPASGAATEPTTATRSSLVAAAFFALLLALSFIVTVDGGIVGVAAAFYRAGALVFGGGHVVLPLLRETTVASGAVSAQEFVSGYGAAQLVPGPLFTFAAFLGARIGGAGTALVALFAIFLPGFLVLVAVLPWWRRVLARAAARRAISGANAAVTGLLAAALYDPVWTSAIGAGVDVAVAAAAFGLLSWRRASVLWAAVLCVGAAVLLARP